MTSARSAAFVVALAATFLLAVALHLSSRASAATELELDTYRADNSLASVVGPVLTNDQKYTITITGTFSYWSASEWQDQGVCVGTAEDAPMFPSPGTTNGKVGVDPAWHFAAPGGGGDCSNTYPRVGHVYIVLDGQYATGQEADDQGTGPNPSHSYHYTVIGKGHQLLIFINDSTGNNDYGILKISVEAAATHTPSPTVSPTPVRQTRKWGDNNCDGSIKVDDATRVLVALGTPAKVAGITDCPDMGQTVQFITSVGGAVPQGAGPLIWGDVRCTQALDPSDPLAVLRYIVSLPDLSHSGFCPEVGHDVTFQ